MSRTSPSTARAPATSGGRAARPGSAPARTRCFTRAGRSRRSETSASTSATTRACGCSTPPSWRSSAPSARAAVERRLAQPAVGTVGDVEADQLVAAAADAQVLDRPDQRGGRRGERENHGHRLHLLAGLLVDVDAVRLGGGELLAPRRTGAEAEELALVLHRGRNDIRHSLR